MHWWGTKLAAMADPNLKPQTFNLKPAGRQALMFIFIKEEILLGRVIGPYILNALVHFAIIIQLL